MAKKPEPKKHVEKPKVEKPKSRHEEAGHQGDDPHKGADDAKEKETGD